MHNLYSTDNITRDTSVLVQEEIFDLDMANHLLTDTKLLTTKERSIVRNMVKNKKRGDKGTYHEVHYRIGLNADRTSEKGKEFYNIGRLIAKGGYQALQKNVRGALAKNYYFDIDMVNAHPTMMIQMCEKEGWECKALRTYVNSRDKIVKKYEKEGYTRDDIKVAALSLMYGKKPDETMPGWFRTTFYGCVNDILIKISKKYPEEFENAKKFKKWNPLGRCASNIMQTLERSCLLSLVKSLEMNGRTVGTLMHDGCYVKKERDDEMYFPEDILRNAEKFIYEKVGYKHTLVVKPIETTFTVPNKKEINIDRTYRNVKDDFEKKHFKCINKSCFYKETEDSIIGMTEQQIKVSYREVYFEEMNNKGNIVEVPFIDRWIKDKDIRKYEDTELCPPPARLKHENNYNLWDGFRMERYEGYADNESVNTLLEHIRLISGDECYDYMIKWIAHMLQYPASIPGVCILIKTEQGLGKQFMFRILEAMIGKKYCVKTANHENIVGKFNNLAENKVLVCLDEMNMTVSKVHEDSIKEMITESEFDINPKRISAYKARNFTHMLVFSNRDFPWKLDQGDRRCLAIDNTNKVPSREYFSEIDLLIEDDPTIKSLYDYFMSIDVRKFDPKGDRPNTEFTKELKEISMPLEQQFYIHYLRKIGLDKESARYVGSNDLYAEFKQFIFENFSDIKNYPSQVKFAISIKKMEGCEPRRSSTERGYVIDVKTASQWMLKNGY